MDAITEPIIFKGGIPAIQCYDPEILSTTNNVTDTRAFVYDSFKIKWIDVSSRIEEGK